MRIESRGNRGGSVLVASGTVVLYVCFVLRYFQSSHDGVLFRRVL